MGSNNIEKGGMSLIVRTIASILLPFILTFGIYVVIHGHLTPGGGFQGGVVLASAALVVLVSFGYRLAENMYKKYKTLYSPLEAFGGILFIIAAAIGLSVAFFYNYLWTSRTLFGGTPGTLWSGGMLPIMNIAVGLKVATGFAGVLALFFIYTYRKSEGEKP